MQDSKSNCAICNESDRFGGNIILARDGGDMGKEDRKRQVLNILVESGLALPPAAIFRNAKLRGATFERRSVNNYLEELLEEGLVMKVDAESLEDGSITEINPSESGYFMATENALERFSD